MPNPDVIGKYLAYGAMLVIAAIFVVFYSIAAAHISLETGTKMWVQYGILSAAAFVSVFFYFLVIMDCYKNN